MKNRFNYKTAFRILKGGNISMVVSAFLAGATMSYAAPASNALPTNGNVVSGNVNISTNSNVMNINQTTNKSIINWNTYNIGSSATVNYNFTQNNSSSLNRVLSNNPSEIYGKLNANGKVILVNPNGVIFGRGSSVNVGSLVATTMNIKDGDYLNDNLLFQRENAIGTILNEGTITADEKGYIALLSPNITNDGVIRAIKGTVTLAAGEKIELTLDSSGLKTIIVEPSTIQTLIENKSLVEADGGLIYIGAKEAEQLLDTAMNIKNSGTLQANSMDDLLGKVTLEAKNIENAGNIHAKGGGEILIGGDWQGTNEDKISHAQKVTLTNTSNIDVSAINDGDGGKVVVWSSLANKGVTTVDGIIKAEGGKNSGNGGKIETSGGSLLFGNNITTSTKAYSGKNGQWLLDPFQVTVDSVLATIIQNALHTGDVTVNATYATNNGASPLYDNTNPYIKVESPISWNTNKLTLSTAGNIYINANLTGTNSAKLQFEYANTSNLNANNVYYTPYNYFVNAKIFLPSGENFITKAGNQISEPVTWKVVTTLEELQNINNDTSNTPKYYVLGADIDATATATWNNGAGFTPIASYTGSFDGLGHTIDKLYINRSQSDNGGLFGEVFNARDQIISTIRNVTLTNVDITAMYRAGSLIAKVTDNILYGGVNAPTPYKLVLFNNHATGEISAGSAVGGLYGMVENVDVSCNSFEGTVSQNANNIVNEKGKGGLIGFATGNQTLSNTISKSYALAAVSATMGSNDIAGGLVGSAYYTSITNSYAQGNIAAAYSGGIIGYTDGYSTLSKTYHVGTTTGSYARPLIGGVSHQTTVNIGDSYYDKTVNQITADQNSNFKDSSTINGRTTEQMKTGSSYVEYVGATNNWGIESLSGSYPTLYCPTNNYDTPWRMSIPLAYHLSNITQIYKGDAYTLSSLYSASSIFGNTYSSWILGTDYKFIRNNQVVTDFTDAGTYSNISIDILKSGFTEATTGNTLGTFTISPFTVTLTGFSAADKTYDGLTTATVSGSINKFGSDDVSVTGIFGDKNAGTNKTVTASLTGAKASNYTLATTTATANISKADITAITGITATNKIYDGTQTATLNTSGVSFTGKISNDSLTVATATGTFDNKNVGTTKTVNIEGLTLGGTDAINYNLTNSTSSTTAQITKKDISNLILQREYDGTTIIKNTATVESDDIIDGETLTISGEGSITSKDASINPQNITLGTIVLADGEDGTLASNYNLIVTPTVLINKKSLTLNGAIAGNKTYDGNTNATISSWGTLVGVVDGETVTIDNSSATSEFENKNAGDGKTVNISGVTLGGADASNYSAGSSMSATANISKADITAITGITATNKIYDGTQTATLNTSGASFTGKIGNDSLTVATSTGAFTNKHVGTGKSVNITGLTLGGDDSINYNLLSSTSTATADITTKAITFTASDVTKIYDGASLYTPTSEELQTLASNLVQGDSLTSITLAFGDKNAGLNNKTVTPSSAVIDDGNSGDNYSVSYVNNTSSTIAPKLLSVSGLIVEDKIYDDSTDALLKAQGTINKVENDEISFEAVATFTNKNIEDNKKVNIDYELSGTDKENYILEDEVNIDTTAKIKKIPLKYTIKDIQITAGGKLELPQAEFEESVFSDPNYEVKLVDKNGDEVSDLSKLPAGKYTIKVTHFQDELYEIEATSKDGILTINPSIQYDATIENAIKQDEIKSELPSKQMMKNQIVEQKEIKEQKDKFIIQQEGISIANPFVGNDSVIVVESGIKTEIISNVQGENQQPILNEEQKQIINQDEKRVVQEELKNEIKEELQDDKQVIAQESLKNLEALSVQLSPNVVVSEMNIASSSVVAKVDLQKSNSFSFTIKEAVAIKMEPKEITDVKATLASGQTLPNWLKFDKETQTFLAINPPEGSLPLETKVTVTGGAKTEVIAVEITK